MADFKLVFNFVSNGNKGGTWSEVWYRSASDLKGASTIPERLLNARLNMLNVLSQLTKIRVSQVLNPRVTTIVHVRKNGTPSIGGGNVPAPIDSAMVCTVSSSVQPATRRFWWRGWDVGQAVRDAVTGNDVFSQGAIDQFAEFLAQAAKANLEILPIQKSSVPGFGYNTATKVDGTANDGTSVITFKAGHLLQPGMTVIMNQFSKKDLPGLQGYFIVLAVAPLTITVKYTTPENQVIVCNTGRVRQLAYISGATIDPTISGISFLGGRKSKSPFTGSRGARSAKRGVRTSP